MKSLDISHVEAKANAQWGALGAAVWTWARKEFADEAWVFYRQIEKTTVLVKWIGFWKLKAKLTIKGHDLHFLFVALFGNEPK